MKSGIAADALWAVMILATVVLTMAVLWSFLYAMLWLLNSIGAFQPAFDQYADQFTTVRTAFAAVVLIFLSLASGIKKKRATR